MSNMNGVNGFFHNLFKIKIISVVVVVCIVVIGVADFADSVKSICNLFFFDDVSRVDKDFSSPVYENNYKKSTAIAIGMGIGAENIENPVKRKFAAKRAAEADAMRKLVETVRGVMIQSKTSVSEGQLVSDVIEIKVRDVLKNAKIISERSLPDGSYEVSMEVELE